MCPPAPVPALPARAGRLAHSTVAATAQTRATANPTFMISRVNVGSAEGARGPTKRAIIRRGRERQFCSVAGSCSRGVEIDFEKRWIHGGGRRREKAKRGLGEVQALNASAESAARRLACVSGPQGWGRDGKPKTPHRQSKVDRKRKLPAAGASAPLLLPRPIPHVHCS